jgi:hypothetical protein
MAETVGGNTVGGSPAAAAGRGHLRASHADREQMIDTLKVAFAQGRLAKDEFDARINQALVSRTYADLAAVVVGIPAELAAAQQPRRASRKRLGNAARWATSGLITPAVIAAAFAADSLRGDGGYAVVAFIVAFVYFVCWLSAGADMLWEWHCTSLPAARTCVRCAHTAASHRTRASCAVRVGSLKVWRRCPCAGYVPPGLSPQTVSLTARPSPGGAQRTAGRTACLSRRHVPWPLCSAVFRRRQTGRVVVAE